MKFKKILICMLSILFILCFNVHADEKFNPQNVYNTIRQLSSDEYKGRLAGEAGNTKTQNYIADYFKQLGLKKGNGKSYFQSFSAEVPYINGDCTLKVYDTLGNKIKEYVYGKDFKELTYGMSSSGTAKSNPSYIETFNSSTNETFSPVVLVHNMPIGESNFCYDSDSKIIASNAQAVIACGNARMGFRSRSPYKEQKDFKKGLIKVITTVDTFNELLDYKNKGYQIEVKSPVNVRKVSLNNVIGVLQGRDASLSPIILSAHFDHVGCDADGTIYPGALDNASGTAFLLECARVFKASGSDRTIIFAAFNAEEEGLLGSQYFASHPTLNIKGAQCINFDMVGTSSKIPLTVLSSSRSSYASDIASKLTQFGIPNTTLVESNSDHASFSKNGYDAVTLIHDDETKIHTPKDTISYISTDSINTVYQAVNAIIGFNFIIRTPANARVTYEQTTIHPALMIIPVLCCAGIVLYVQMRKKSVK